MPSSIACPTTRSRRHDLDSMATGQPAVQPTSPSSASPEEASASLAIPLLTVPEVVRRLGITKQAVYQMIHSGTLPAQLVPGWRLRYLIRATDLAAYETWRASGHIGPTLCADDLSLAEDARLLGMAYSTLQYQVAQGIVPTHWHGKGRRAVRRADLARVRRKPQGQRVL